LTFLSRYAILYIVSTPDPLKKQAGFVFTIKNMLTPIISYILLTSPIWARTILPKISSILLVGIIFVAPNYAYAAEINASELIELTNQNREQAGLNILNPNHNLTQAAQAKAKYLMEHNVFAHTTPEGKPFYEWIEENKYHYLYAGENLAIDFKTSEATVEAWMESPTHRANILNKNYVDIGIVALRGDWEGRETVVVVQMFGSLLTDSPTVLGQAIENASSALGIRTDSLKTLASDLIMLPSLAGSKYFDIVLRPKEEIKIATSNPTLNAIAQSPITKIVQGEKYQTLLKTKQTCCSKDATFALTEEKKGALFSTPISYPRINSIFAKVETINFLNLPLSSPLYNNLLIAGFLCLLLLFAFEKELKEELAKCKK